MSDDDTRIERDSMGQMRVPAAAKWGAQTQRAVQNFPLSGIPMPARVVHALGLIKAAAALANLDAGVLEQDVARAIVAAAMRVAHGECDEQFPVDVFQTGSGTSSNMNANEVIATLAGEALGAAVHPNDQVNASQSSNDVFPTAIHLSAALAIDEELLPSLAALAQAIDAKREEVGDVVKTGRTHLMDAMPLTLGQEMSGWAQQVRDARERIGDLRPRLSQLAQGGTAVGTGVNAPAGFAPAFCGHLSELTGATFRPARNYFAALSAPDTAVAVSGELKSLAAGVMKICNDLRWANSGPLAGLGEIRLPALQPGSSIMPGKVNPVMPEAVAMACAQVIGNDVTVTLAGQSGNFQLNVMLPVIAHNLLQSIHLMATGTRLLAERAIGGLSVDRARLAANLARNPILVTALNPVVGYALGAQMAKRAYEQGRPIRDVAREMTDLSDEELDRLLDPVRLTGAKTPQ